MNQFGDDRLLTLLEKNAGAQPKEIVETTFAQVQLHADGANQSDDITVMCIKICQ
jgi:serine phosphatase RsbU (regulator of sigma subunit)